MNATWMFTAAVAAVGCAGMLWRELQQHKEEPDTTGSKWRKRIHQMPASAAAAIAPHEMKQLQSFLHKVYSWRGWQGGSYHVAQAWHAAEAAGGTAAGGSWLQDFDLAQMTNANCNALLMVIDDSFCGGKLLKFLAAKAKRNQQELRCQADNAAASAGSTGNGGAGTAADRSNHRQRSNAGSSALDSSSSMAGKTHDSSLGSSTSGSTAENQVCCKVVQQYGPTDTWLAYFDVSNIIFINNWRWVRKHVTTHNPLNCEGVICTSRLQMLLHTLAHELVHAVVFHAFPEIDQSGPAYLENDRHGPIFQLLNKQLFGHTSDALERVQLLGCRH